MKLTQKLIGYLNRVFERGPADVLALRIRYDGDMSWTVSDGVLTTAVTGGSGAALSLQLADFTVAGLAAQIAATPGYSVPYLSPSLSAISSLAILDGAGSQGASNGDHLRAYTSVLWAYMDAKANELTTAAKSVDEALLQMSVPTARGEWLDAHGSYYGVFRRPGELDASYGPRIVSEVGLPRGNNIAIAQTLDVGVGADDVRVIDYRTVTVAVDGTKSYGLFDVEVAVDINSPLPPVDIEANVRAIIESMRDAGTFLRNLRITRTATQTVFVGSVLQVGQDVTIKLPGGGCCIPGYLYMDGSAVMNGDWAMAGLAMVDAPNVVAPMDGSIRMNGAYQSFGVYSDCDGRKRLLMDGVIAMDGSAAMPGFIKEKVYAYLTMDGSSIMDGSASMSMTEIDECGTIDYLLMDGSFAMSGLYRASGTKEYQA